MKECIRCGFCCLECSCGLATQEPCEYLKPGENGQYTCVHYPFDRLGIFEQMCLGAGDGCSYDGQNDMYRKLYKKLNKEDI